MNEEGFTSFLNGLEVSDQELPVSASIPSVQDGVLFFNAGKMSVKYDPMKWKLTPPDQGGRFMFTHSSGSGYAMVIAERLEISMDSLPDVALANAKTADPNARILFQEKRKVQGIEVWFLRFEAELKGIPFVYLGYFYSGKTGTVQMFAFTGKNLLAEFEKDFMEFLDGLSVPD